MTIKTLEVANANRNMRNDLLKEYDKVNHAINNLDAVKPNFFYAVEGKVDMREVYPSKNEMRNLFLNMRDRYDAEISRLDKEFEAL